MTPDMTDATYSGDEFGLRPWRLARLRCRACRRLGAGTSEKTLLLLDALTVTDSLERFVPLDASEEILRASAHTIAGRYPTLGVHAIVGDFERHLRALPAGD